MEFHLKNYPALQTIHKGRACAGIAPEPWQAPYQTFFLISDPFPNRRIGVPCPRFQINNFAPDYAQAKQMAGLTLQALDGYSGWMGGSGGILVEAAIYQEMSDLYEPDTKLYNVMIDFVILYHENL